MRVSLSLSGILMKGSRLGTEGRAFFRGWKLRGWESWGLSLLPGEGWRRVSHGRVLRVDEWMSVSIHGPPSHSFTLLVRPLIWRVFVCLTRLHGGLSGPSNCFRGYPTAVSLGT